MTAKQRAELVTTGNGASMWFGQMPMDTRYHVRDIFEREIQAAIDEALEQAAKFADGHKGHSDFHHEFSTECQESIALQIRALQSQSQPLPPTVKPSPYFDSGLEVEGRAGSFSTEKIQTGVEPSVKHEITSHADHFADADKMVKHGVDCPKVEHSLRRYYGHWRAYDGPVYLDCGEAMCGRCHGAL